MNLKTLLILTGLILGGIWLGQESVRKLSSSAISVSTDDRQDPFLVSSVKEKSTGLEYATPSIPLVKSVENIAQSMQNPNSNLNVEELSVKAQGLSHKDLVELKQFVMNQNLEAKFRRASLFLLTQSGLAAAPILGEIAKSAIPLFAQSKDPHSIGALAKNYEVSLRITALEALDKLSVTSTDVMSYLMDVSQTQKDPTLLFLTNISIAGIQGGKPGKLNRAIEAMIHEKAAMMQEKSL